MQSVVGGGVDCENRGRGGGATASPAVGKLRTMCLQVTGLLENTASLSTKRVPGNSGVPSARLWWWVKSQVPRRPFFRSFQDSGLIRFDPVYWVWNKRTCHKKTRVRFRDTQPLSILSFQKNVNCQLRPPAGSRLASSTNVRTSPDPRSACIVHLPGASTTSAPPHGPF